MTDRLAPLWKLLHDGAPDGEIQKVGADISKNLEAQVAEIAREKRIVDEVLALKAPVVRAWTELSMNPVNGQQETIRAIVRELHAQGACRVETSQVFGILTQRGTRHTWKNPRTAIGNIILQMPNWKKVETGVYEFREGGEVK